MAIEQEKVRFELEALTSGLEEVRKFREELNQTQKTGENASRTQTQQSRTSETLTNRFGKMTNPLREIGGLFQKLSPSVLVASLGMTALVGQFKSADSGLNKFTINLTTATGLINQFSSENFTADEALVLFKEHADELDQPLSRIIEAYDVLLPVTRDLGVSQGILNDAHDVHLETGRPLIDVVNDLSAAYAEGELVVDEYGSQLYLGAEAVDALAKEMIEGGSEIIQARTEIDNAFDTMWEDTKRNWDENMGTLAKLFKAGLLVIIDPEKNMPLLKNALIDMGDTAWVAFLKGFKDKAEEDPLAGPLINLVQKGIDAAKAVLDAGIAALTRKAEAASSNPALVVQYGGHPYRPSEEPDPVFVPGWAREEYDAWISAGGRPHDFDPGPEPEEDISDFNSRSPS